MAGGALFQYKDRDGVDVVVDRLEDVPQQYRGKMKILTMESAEVKAPTKAEVAAVPAPAPLAQVDMAAGAPFAVGGVAVGLALGLALGRSGIGRKLGMMALFLVASAAVMTFYASTLRQQTGVASSPATIVTDTQKAKALLEQHNTTQQKALEEIERSEK